MNMRDDEPTLAPKRPKCPNCGSGMDAWGCVKCGNTKRPAPDISKERAQEILSGPKPSVMRDIPTKGLPTDDEGHIITSAQFGEHHIVKITYNTNADGRPWYPGEHEIDEQPSTLHGPFKDEAEAMSWIEAYPDGDTDIDDMVVITLNAVRPKEDA